MTTAEPEYVSTFMGKDAPPLKKPWTQQEKDAAKRASDILNEAIAEFGWELRDRFMAIRLSDGGSDRVIYDTKRDAVRGQLHEQQCAYIMFRNILGGTTEREMLRVLRFNRMAYDAGFRLTDPDDVNGGADLAPSAMLIDRLSGRVRGQRQ